MTSTKYDNVAVVGKVSAKTLQVEKGVSSGGEVTPSTGQALVAADENGNLTYATISGTDVNVQQTPIGTSTGEYPLLAKSTTGETEVTGTSKFKPGVTVNKDGKVSVGSLRVGTTSTAGKALIAADANGNITWGNATPANYLKSAAVSGDVLTLTKENDANVTFDVSGKANASQLTDGSVTKVGTATVGAADTPIYLNAGVPTAGTQLGAAAYKSVQTGGTSDTSGLTTKDYVDSKVTSVFTYKGSDTYAQIILKTNNVKGDVWNSTTEFVISSGSHAGTYPKGTNLVCTTTQSAASASIWDPLGGDVSTFVKKTGDTMTGPLSISGGQAIATNAFRNISAGSSAPTGGALGDVYLQVGGTPHLGTSTVGSATQPIYLDGGVPTVVNGQTVYVKTGTVSISASSTSVTVSNLGFTPKIVQLYENNVQIEAGITLSSNGFTVNIATSGTAYSWTYNAIGW